MLAQPKWVKGSLLTVALALGIGSAPAWAQKSFGVAGGIYEPVDKEATGRTGVFGIRGAYRLKNSPFGLEAALNQADLSDLFPVDPDPGIPGLDIQFKIRLFNLDLSAQWFPKGSGLVVFGGGGMSRLETRLRLTSEGENLSATSTSTTFTAHAGVGYEWGLGSHLFVRPEARYRYFFSDNEPGDNVTVIFDASGPEANLVLGWKLGARTPPQ
jgi:hypothetical protein